MNMTASHSAARVRSDALATHAAAPPAGALAAAPGVELRGKKYLQNCQLPCSAAYTAVYPTVRKIMATNSTGRSYAFLKNPSTVDRPKKDPTSQPMKNHTQ